MRCIEGRDHRWIPATFGGVKGAPRLEVIWCLDGCGVSVPKDIFFLACGAIDERNHADACMGNGTDLMHSWFARVDSLDRPDIVTIRCRKCDLPPIPFEQFVERYPEILS